MPTAPQIIRWRPRKHRRRFELLMPEARRGHSDRLFAMVYPADTPQGWAWVLMARTTPVTILDGGSAGTREQGKIAVQRAAVALPGVR